MIRFSPGFVERALLNQKIRKVRQTTTEGLCLSADPTPLKVDTPSEPLSLAYTPDILHRLMPGAPIGCPASVGASLMEEGRSLKAAFPDAFVRYLILPEGARRVRFAHELIPLCDLGVIVLDNEPAAIGELADALSVEGSIGIKFPTIPLTLALK